MKASHHLARHAQQLELGQITVKGSAEMSSWDEGYRQGKIIGNIVFGLFKVAWFFLRIAWWLLVLLVASIAGGVAALARSRTPAPDPAEGFGRYSADRALWQDASSGQWYPVRPGEMQECTVREIEGGLDWKRTALSRLVRSGAIVSHTFAAVSGDPTGQLMASEEFLNEARHNITVDHLDPARAAEDPYGLASNREQAEAALEHLDWLLSNKGWERQDDDLRGHWYARVYRRPGIEWDAPLAEADVPAVES